MYLAVLGLRCRADFSLVAVSGGCSVVEVCRLLSLQSPGSRTRRLHAVRGSAVVAHRVSCTVVAPWPVEPSQIRDRTYVSCVSRQILYP